MALSTIGTNQIASGAVTVPKVADQVLSSRNLLINGEHKVSQRGTSFTAQGANGGPYFTDRWYCYSGGTSAGRFTATQEAITDLSGFKNALKLDCTTADTSIGADEQLSIIQTIEAQNLQHLKFGTSDAVSLTYSFFAKANATKTYIAELYTADSVKSQSHAFTVTTSWQRFEITFSATGADAATINNDNGQGMYVILDLHAGSNLTSGTINSTWLAATQANRMPGCGSFFSSTDNTFFLTGAQLEIGETATPFEHRSYGDELARCQRYYVHFGAQGSYTNYAFGSVTNGTTAEIHASLPVTMRDEPVIETSATLGNFRTWDGGGGYTVTSINQGNYSNLNVGSINVGCSGGGMTTGRAVKLQDNGTHTDNYIAFKAEL